ncbi:hypothetical protein KPL71_013969 [Citrus sinensis]|uniref:Uncharacterized protein n=1 Tax=Citrus sinensis TaxID=2711 RepID=A0ACB8K8H4_CITSI|nr:hypothetical protein KPL71_013969 [Citrus sinensis]
MIVMTGAARMCWIYFMKLKYEVADIFVKFKAWVETQSRCKMQVIRSDNGTKDTFEKFNKFCEDAGIEHQLTAPYTPQQNGVVERKNRTLMEMARSLLCDKGLPKKFWAEAVNTVVFLLNRLPTKALQKKTPFEAWTKLNHDGSVNKQKARLVVKEYAQMCGVDFSETFAPVARLDTIRMLLALAAHRGQEEKAYRLKKALHSLKQVLRSWYSRIDTHLANLGFEKSLSESTLYIKKADNEILVVSLYVDDLLVTRSSKELIDRFKEEMKDVFEMTDLGKMTFFLGIQVHQKENEIFLCQQKYAKEVLKKFNMEECKPTATPMNQKEKFCKEDGAEMVDERLYRSLIGCLLYLTTTGSDIMHAMSMLSRYMHCASEIHFQAAKRILRYVNGTIDYGIRFSQVKNFNLHRYFDSDCLSPILKILT